MDSFYVPDSFFIDFSFFLRFLSFNIYSLHCLDQKTTFRVSPSAIWVLNLKLRKTSGLVARVLTRNAFSSLFISRSPS